jgi:hypothetical protein
VEADVPEEKAGNSPGDLIQKAKASMRDSPFGLADLALPTLGALGSVALNDAHNWSCEYRIVGSFLGVWHGQIVVVFTRPGK